MAGTGVGKYSTTPANNESVQSTNWAEGMAPSDVNNAARETLANVRLAVNDIAAGFVELGDTDGEYTVTKIDADTFTINTSVDLRTDYYQVGRKIKVTHSNGTTTGTIESTAFSSPTLTVNLSGANITGASITKVELGLPSAGGAANLDMDDNAKLRLGDSQDLQIFHDSSNSIIADSGTGALQLRGSGVNLMKADGSAAMLNSTDGGAVELFHNGTKKLETTSVGTTITGDLAVSGAITAGGNNVAQSAYPVGSIYMNINATNPNSLLGFGTWARFGEGKMLVSQNSSDSDFDTAEETGGGKTHTIAQTNLPNITLQTNELVKIEQAPANRGSSSGAGSSGRDSGAGSSGRDSG